MNRNYWSLLSIGVMPVVPAYLVEYLIGTHQIPYLSSPFQPEPPLVYIPNTLSGPLKH